MYATVPGARVPLRMWTDPATVEDAAMAQLHNVARLPWVHGVAVMPDVHYGKGATVGSVIAMRGAVCPAAVGVDIGCGMSAVRTSLRAEDLPDDLSRLYGLAAAGWDDFWTRFDGLADAVKFRRERALTQMGTLGGGNHFIEFCLDEYGAVW